MPVERLDLVQKYTGAARPALDRLGGTTWEKAKTRVKKAMRDMAEELLKLYAARKAVPGHAFSPDSHWQQEFEDAFEYDLTVDQSNRDRRHQARHGVADADGSPAVRRRRLRQDRSGDARRVQGGDGRQAGRVPRADDGPRVPAPEDAAASASPAFPVRIDMVSRFRTKAGAEGDRSTTLAAGKVDIIVGTHRLLSKDVQFKDLGLLVVDEEQRFGVAHKERIKQMRKKVDVLTMTATPIPRTLHMSLVGIRDMSIIETPPKDRLSIQTNVVKFDPAVIRRAIRSELERGGQVYFVHNRVESIFAIGNLISGWCRRRASSSATARWARTSSSRRCSTSSRTSSTSCWRRRSSRTASTSRTPTRSSSTAPIATACRSSISCAAASAAPIGRPTPTC